MEYTNLFYFISCLYLPQRQNISSSVMAGQMTPEDEKGPGEEMQEQAHASSHEQLTLETIPNEIISSIAGMLAVGIHLPYEVSRIFLKTSENGKQQHSNARRDLPGAHKSLHGLQTNFIQRQESPLYQYSHDTCQHLGPSIPNLPREPPDWASTSSE